MELAEHHSQPMQSALWPDDTLRDELLARIGRRDVEAQYRYHWLLYQLLEDHFALRGAWYRGPKEAFATLRATAPATHAAFARALAPGADADALAALVEHVVGPDPG